jgi:hypothetical protein
MKSHWKEKYWRDNYSEPEEMDCIGNVDQHITYMKTVFELDLIDISSVIDFGFGMGVLFREVLKTFIPYKAYGLEPSEYIYNQTNLEKLRPVESTKLKIENIDLLNWSQKKKHFNKCYDLGLCTSVLQYIDDQELEKVLPVMAKKVKYLYLTVPTNKELDNQIEDLEFHDQYAIRRSRKQYKKLLSPHFTFISSRILESKAHFDESNTNFSDLLFRF